LAEGVIDRLMLGMVNKTDKLDARGLNKLHAIVERCIELDPGFAYGGPLRVLAAYWAKHPFGKDHDRVKELPTRAAEPLAEVEQLPRALEPARPLGVALRERKDPGAEEDHGQAAQEKEHERAGRVPQSPPF